MRDMRREIERWIAGMSRITRIGGIILLLGAAIDLFYHAVLEPFFPLPGVQDTLVAYVGHLTTFAGMIIMLLSVAWEAWRHPRSQETDTPPDGVSMRRQ